MAPSTGGREGAGVLIELGFSAGDLARMRFAVSPMWEVWPASGFRLLVRSGTGHPVHRRWAEQVAPGMAAAGLDRGWLAELIPASGYLPDFLNPAPADVVRGALDHLRYHQGGRAPGCGPCAPPDPPQLTCPGRGSGPLWESRPVTGSAAAAAVLGRSRTLLLTEPGDPGLHHGAGGPYGDLRTGRVPAPDGAARRGPGHRPPGGPLGAVRPYRRRGIPPRSWLLLSRPGGMAPRS